MLTPVRLQTGFNGDVIQINTQHQAHQLLKQAGTHFMIFVNHMICSIGIEAYSLWYR